MDRKVIDQEKLKDIFNKMDYDQNGKESVDSAFAWIKKRENNFTVFEPGKESVRMSISGSCNLDINATRISNDNIEGLLKECENSIKEWNNISGIQKAKFFNKVSSEIDKQSALICQVELLIRNILVKDTKSLSIPMFNEYFQYYSGWANIKEKKLLEYQPYGICVISLKSTTPLSLIGMLLAPCLAAGNVIILSAEKELIPICFLIKEILETVGFSKGLINIVRGTLDVILKHEKVSKFTYIGDLFHEKFTSLDIKNSISLNTLHLGKGTMIVFDTADIDSACDSVLDITMGYRGDYPWSVNKILVQESIFEQFQEKIKKKYFDVTTTDPYLKITDYAKLIDFKFGAKEAGCNVILSNEDHFVNVMAFRTANEAVNLANNTRLGLACSVWTENINLANEITSKLKVGIVWINTHGIMTSGCTFTPYKKSGKGYFGGKEGLLEYLRCKEHHYCSTNLSKLDGKSCEANRKDIRNYVESAIKAQDGWKKLPIKNRSQTLRKFADNSSTIDSNFTNNWISTIYEWATISSSISSLNISTPSLTSIKEPNGLIVLEIYNDPKMIGFNLIIAAITCGNSVVVLNRSEENKFLKDIVSKCSLPSGILKVVFDPNEEIIQTLKSHQEIQAYYTVCNNDIVNITSKHILYDIANVNINSNDCLFDMFTKTKCIWCTNVESFL